MVIKDAQLIHDGIDIGYNYKKSIEVTFMEYHPQGRYYSIFPFVIETDDKKEAIKQARILFKQKYNLESTKGYLIRTEVCPPKAEEHPHNRIGRFKGANTYEDQIF